MAVRVRAVKARNPKDPGGQYQRLTVVSGGVLGPREAAEKVAARTGVARADALSTTEAHLDVMVEQLEAGGRFRLGEIGLFLVTAEAALVPAGEKPDVRKHVKRLRIRFLPSPELKRRLANVQVVLE